MSILKKISRRISGHGHRILGAGQSWKIRLCDRPVISEFTRERWKESLKDPSGFYRRAHAFFHDGLPEELREHRRYFRAERRGFGEDAFSVLWFLLVNEFGVKRFAEIGVYRGQTLSLVSLLQKRLGIEGEVCGISPFSTAGDSVSVYAGGIDYFEDTLKNFEHFGLSKPRLIRAYSTDAPAVEILSGESWDAIYIDGNHDYEIALQDWNACARGVRSGGIIVLDDSGLRTSYRPPLFATGGHPGPSRLAAEIDRTRFEEILQVGHNRVFQKR